MPIIKAKRLRVLGKDGKWHDIPAVDNTASAVKYIPQELTDEQKAQARENIGALPDTTEIPPQYTLPQATSDALGGIKADAATAEDTQAVRIGADGRLYTAPSSGGGGSGGGIPAITEADEGRVLTASGGVAVWQDLPKYGGTYTVTPEVDTVQTLETAQKYMDADVRIEKIPYYEMDNASGGTTIYIGSDDEIITK